VGASNDCCTRHILARAWDVVPGGARRPAVSDGYNGAMASMSHRVVQGSLVYNGHALGTLTTLGVVLLSAAATVCQPHVLLLYLDRPCDSVVLAAHTQGSSLRGCAWFHVVEGCTGHVGGQPAHLSLAHGCHHTIVVPSPTAGRQAPPRTTSHARARKCSVQQSFDPPTCGSLYRGHWCTMGTRWAPSLHLVLCCLVPLPPCANRTYYYYIWTVGGVLAAHTQGSSLRGCAWFHVVEGCTGVTRVQWARTGHPHYAWCCAPATVCHRTHALPVFGPLVVCWLHTLRAHL
jgi:hypothetical protein